MQANGEAVETLVISGGTSSEDGNTYYQGLLPAITLPQGTTEVEIQVSEGVHEGSIQLRKGLPV